MKRKQSLEEIWNDYISGKLKHKGKQYGYSIKTYMKFKGYSKKTIENFFINLYEKRN